MSVQVVSIAEHHAEGFRAALDSVARERKYLAQVEAQPFDAVLEFVRRSVEADLPHFVALDGELVVGWCDVIPAWAHAVQHRGTLGMGVVREYRSRGVGTRLLAACLEKARRKGISRVELEVRSDNASAIRLYERFGFVREATLKNAMRLDGEYYGAIQMSLLQDMDP